MPDHDFYSDDESMYIGGDPRLDHDASGSLEVTHDAVQFLACNGTGLVWPLTAIRYVVYRPGHQYTADELSEAHREAKRASQARGWELAHFRMDDIPPGVLMLVDDPEKVFEHGWPVRLGFRSDYFARVFEKRLRDAANLATPDQERSLEQLVAKGEGERLEFKERLTPSSAKSIAAFLNTVGGTLLIGVADDGTIIGLREDNYSSADDYMLRMTNLMRTKLTIAARDLVDVTIIDAAVACRINCLPSPDPVYFHAESGVPDQLFVRRGASTERLEGRSLLEYCQRRF